jgi:hypothetical protein
VIAARWQSDAWRPVARVLFIRETHCKRCGQTFESPHWPETFIQERLVRDPKAYRYLPAKSSITASIQLPRRREIVRVEAYACHLCPDFQVSEPLLKDSPQCLEDLLLSRLAATGSSQSKVVQTSSISLVAGCSSLTSNPFPPGTISMALDWSPISSESYVLHEESARKYTSWAPGLGSGSSASAPSAPAMLMTFPIMQGRDSASMSAETTVSDSSEEHF